MELNWNFQNWIWYYQEDVQSFENLTELIDDDEMNLGQWIGVWLVLKINFISKALKNLFTLSQIDSLNIAFDLSRQVKLRF